MGGMNLWMFFNTC